MTCTRACLAKFRALLPIGIQAAVSVIDAEPTFIDSLISLVDMVASTSGEMVAIVMAVGLHLLHGGQFVVFGFVFIAVFVGPIVLACLGRSVTLRVCPRAGRGCAAAVLLCLLEGRSACAAAGQLCLLAILWYPTLYHGHPYPLSGWGEFPLGLTVRLSLRHVQEGRPRVEALVEGAGIQITRAASFRHAF